jgi:hypothetical protein
MEEDETRQIADYLKDLQEGLVELDYRALSPVSQILGFREKP